MKRRLRPHWSTMSRANWGGGDISCAGKVVFVCLIHIDNKRPDCELDRLIGIKARME